MFSNLTSQYLSTTPPCVPGNPAGTHTLPAADMCQVLSEIATLRSPVVSLQACDTQLVTHSSAPTPPDTSPLPPPGTLPQLGPQLVAIPNVPTDNRYSLLSEMMGN